MTGTERGHREETPEQLARWMARRRAMSDLLEAPAIEEILEKVPLVRVAVRCQRGHEAGLTATLSRLTGLAVTGISEVGYALSPDGDRELVPALKLRCTECGRTVDRSQLSLVQDVLRVAAWDAARGGLVSPEVAADALRLLPHVALSKGQKKPAVII